MRKTWENMSKPLEHIEKTYIGKYRKIMGQYRKRKIIGNPL
jgi:hypothetical protein